MGAKDNGGIIGFGFEIDAVIVGGGQGNLQFRLFALQLQQPWHQPAHGAGGHLQAHHRLLRPGLVRHREKMFIRRAQIRQQGAALRGETQPASVALKQRKTKPAFQRGDLTAHRPLGQAELFCRMGQIQMSGGNNKRLNGSERECAMRHRTSRYDFLSWLL